MKYQWVLVLSFFLVIRLCGSQNGLIYLESLENISGNIAQFLAKKEWTLLVFTMKDSSFRCQKWECLSKQKEFWGAITKELFVLEIDFITQKVPDQSYLEMACELKEKYHVEDFPKIILLYRGEAYRECIFSFEHWRLFSETVNRYLEPV